MRYHNVVSKVMFSDTFGLWGSFAGQSSDGYLRYHIENMSTSLLKNGSDVIYCPMAAIACAPETCVSPKSSLQLLWNATSCVALGVQAGDAFTCVWAGGLASTTADSSASGGVLSCPVPILNISDGSVVTVDIVRTPPTPSEHTQAVSQLHTAAGSHSVYGATLGSGGELARTHLMVRYSFAPQVSCGCSPLPIYAGKSCDKASVCGGVGDTVDCAGSPFGSAYLDSCGNCAG